MGAAVGATVGVVVGIGVATGVIVGVGSARVIFSTTVTVHSAWTFCPEDVPVETVITAVPAFRARI